MQSEKTSHKSPSRVACVCLHSGNYLCCESLIHNLNDICKGNELYSFQSSIQTILYLFGVRHYMDDKFLDNDLRCLRVCFEVYALDTAAIDRISGTKEKYSLRANTAIHNKHRKSLG